MKIEFTKRTDGAVVMRCVRDDGSATWQRQEGRHALFFPFHDLTHYAVESVLGFHHAFFGLLADGWSIDETGGKGARGALPNEATLVEQIVGLIERERAGGAPAMSASEFASQLAALERDGRVRDVRPIDDAELDAVRARREELHEEWARLATGSTLVLEFARSERVA